MLSWWKNTQEIQNIKSVYFTRMGKILLYKERFKYRSQMKYSIISGNTLLA